MLNHKIVSILIFITLGSFISCLTNKSVRHLKHKIPSNSSIAVIVDCPNNIKNVVLARFMKKRFNVKAINASDFYSIADVYDIKDLKKISYKSSLKDTEALLSMEKTYENLYKLHVYNFEMNKAEILSEMRKKWKVKYLLLFSFHDWEEVSWGRAIDLTTHELIWVENYPTKFRDNLETVVDHFIRSFSGS
ncbi:MAG: hypothetical protein SVR08_09620 [Spirochaetota bacterium]|nr:hypothetical protein [Spirochaetota bacterium]